MDSRSLPQNKVSVGSDQLSKFSHFAWKSVSRIWALSLPTEGTITTRKLRRTYWRLELGVDVARDGSPMPGSHNVAMQLHAPPPSRINRHRVGVLHFASVWAWLAGACSTWTAGGADHTSIWCRGKRKSEVEREREKKRTWKRAREREVGREARGRRWVAEVLSSELRHPLPWNTEKIAKKCGRLDKGTIRRKGLSLSLLLISYHGPITI